ncbi:MAG: FctA domain-containing protein [Hornefia sp.]|nr:FctA domain-containing protein [Hornefia sp.]
MVNKKSTLMIVLFSMIISLFSAQSVMAEHPDLVPDVDVGRKGSLTINFIYHKDKNNHVAVSGAAFEIYKVANLTTSGGSAAYKALPEFTAANIKYNGMTKESSVSAAKKLSDIVERKNIKGSSDTTDSQGRASFSGMTHGIYLVMQKGALGHAKAYLPLEPYLVVVPGIERVNEANEWKYDVVLEPKPATIKKKVQPIDISLKFKKKLKNKTLKNGMFRFTLREADSAWRIKPKGITKTVYNDGKGDITFNLNIKKEGTYNYIVREIDDGQKNIIYDKSEMRAIVKIYENEEGQLKIRDIQQQGDSTFYNRIKRNPIHIITGDSTNLAIFIIILAGTMAVLIATVKKRKKM